MVTCEAPVRCETSEQGATRERPANAEMVEGFLDGYDMTAPEPSSNRSNSYRHGFFVGRLDKDKSPPRYSADQLRRMADEAMEADEPRGC